MDALRQTYERSKNPFDIQNLFRSFSINDVILQQPFAPVIHSLLPKLYFNSKRYSMLERWEYRPDYCSYDIYGTTNLYWIIMYVNGCPSATEFTKRRFNFIIAPSIKDISEMQLFVHINSSLL